MSLPDAAAHAMARLPSPAPETETAAAAATDAHTPLVDLHSSTMHAPLDSPDKFKEDVDADADDASDHDAYDTDGGTELDSIKGERDTLASDPLMDDLESQKKLPTRADAGAEYQVPTRTKFIYLGGYFLCNLSLTIYNKAVLGGFAFPWLLTTLHASSVSIGCYILLLRGYFSLTKLSTHENLVLVAFSFLFTINIAISNVSLAAVSVPFHQIMRSTCPVFTILVYRVWYSRSYSTATYWSLVPIIFGVGLATYGDYYFSLLGFLLTLLGVLLAVAKTIVSNRLMTGTLKLPPLELLLRMSPLAAGQGVIYALITGEAGKFITFVQNGSFTWVLGIILIGNGALAFALNVSSFQTNKLAGALTLTVAANLKQILTILLGIALFNVTVGLLNGLGMLITLIGAAWYSKVELDSKGKK